MAHPQIRLRRPKKDGIPAPTEIQYKSRKIYLNNEISYPDFMRSYCDPSDFFGGAIADCGADRVDYRTKRAKTFHMFSYLYLPPSLNYNTGSGYLASSVKFRLRDRVNGDWRTRDSVFVYSGQLAITSYVRNSNSTMEVFVSDTNYAYYYYAALYYTPDTFVYRHGGVGAFEVLQADLPLP